MLEDPATRALQRQQVCRAHKVRQLDSMELDDCVEASSTARHIECSGVAGSHPPPATDTHDEVGSGSARRGGGENAGAPRQAHTSPLHSRSAAGSVYDTTLKRLRDVVEQVERRLVELRSRRAALARQHDDTYLAARQALDAATRQGEEELCKLAPGTAAAEATRKAVLSIGRYGQLSLGSVLQAQQGTLAGVEADIAASMVVRTQHLAWIAELVAARATADDGRARASPRGCRRGLTGLSTSNIT